MVLQVESFNIIGENTFIWMVEANNHTVSVVINTEYIFVQGCIRVIHEACNAVIIIQSSDKRSISGCGVCCDQTFSRQNIKNIRN